MEETQSNPRAASVRVLSKRASAYKGQRMHDLRHGKQPAYVDDSRTDLNRVLIHPPTPSAITKICADRRAQRETRRAMKAGTNVAYIGVITFGAEAQILFRALEPDAQDAAYLEVARAMADRLNTSVEGLVVHNDESAPHAHVVFPAYDLDGQPLTKSVKRGALFAMQDDLGEIMGRHAPGIERGQPRAARIAAGASVAETINRSVRQLHADLPAEIAAKAKERDEAAARVDEMKARVDKLKEKESLTDKEVKRLQTYEKRLADRIAEQEAIQAEAERLAGIATAEAETAAKTRDQARADEAEAVAKVERITRATKALAEEVNAGTLRRNAEGRVVAQDGAALKEGVQDLGLGPAIRAGADAGTARFRSEEISKKARDEAEAEADKIRKAAAEDRALAAKDREEAATVVAEAETLRKRLRKAIRTITDMLPEMPQFLQNRAKGVIRAVEDSGLIPPEKTPPKPPRGGDDGGGGSGPGF